MELSLALELAAERYPEQEAVVTPHVRLSYREWNKRVHAVACHLAQHGIGQGDYAAICAGNGEAPLTMFFAIHRVGAVAVMLNARWKSKDIAYALFETGAKAVFFDAFTEEEVRKAVNTLNKKPILINNSLDLQSEQEVSFADWASKFTAPHFCHVSQQGGTILYTSGTTGEPKGACRSAASDFFGVMGLIIEHGWERFERILAIMPLYHTMGLHSAISIVQLNGTLVIPDKASAKEYLHWMEKEKVSALYLIPTLYHDLVEQKAGNSLVVKKLAYAGAAMNVSLIEKCINVFQPQLFVNHYGCTEMLCITANRNLMQKPLAAGRPSIFSCLRIVKASRDASVSPEDTLAAGELGEIIVKVSPAAFSGYFRKESITKRVVRQGWYFTGDLGYVDENGDLFVKGRVDDMIISGGENIYPEEVETILLEHPQVKDVAVIGEPHRRWGEAVTACIVPASPTLSPAELEDFCLASPKLARFKRPRRFVFVKEIPKTESGKVLRKLLKKHLFTYREE
ncbi:MAG: AMP-binding protein [Firmicutes bacterium]|nr:AMP-binding protein [Bacillota bacterium]